MVLKEQFLYTYRYIHNLNLENDFNDIHEFQYTGGVLESI